MTGSCGDSMSVFEGGDASVAVGAIAVGDVVGDGALGGVPVAVPGVLGRVDFRASHPAAALGYKQ